MRDFRHKAVHAYAGYKTYHRYEWVSCFLQFAQRLEGMLDRGAVHPKMEKLQAILVQHFTALRADVAPGRCANTLCGCLA